MEISESAIAQFRNPKAYLDWFESLLEITKAKHYKEAALRHKGEFKVLYEEIFPVASLLKLKYQQWADTKIRHIRGSQNYDIELLNNELSYIEIVYTSFDAGELFRMNQLINEGHVNALAPVKFNSRKRAEKIPECEWYSHEEMITGILSIIEKSIRKKAQKKYPPKTGLLVYFDDFKYYTTNKHSGSFNCLLNDLEKIWTETFDAVFIVGPRAETLYEKWKH